MKRHQQGESMVGILAVVAIIAIAIAVIYFYNPFGKTTASDVPVKGSDKKTVLGRSMDAGREVECQTNLKNIRASIDMYKSNDVSANPANPPSLDSLKEIPSQMRSCPVGHEAYTYDAQTGQVHCPHHGHDKF